MNRTVTTAVVALAQLALVGAAVAPQLSARLTGDTYVLRVALLDPIDPFRGAYVALDYPDLRRDDPASDGSGGSDGSGSIGSLDDDRSGDLFITLRRDGDVWVQDAWSRERPDDGPYLACDDRGWEVRCGIDSWFLPQDRAAAAEDLLRDGAVAEVRIDARGHAAVVDVRAP